MMAIVNPI